MAKTMPISSDRGCVQVPLSMYRTRVSTSAQLCFPVHVSLFARTIKVKQTRCGGGRLPLPEGIKPEAPHLASASQGGRVKPASRKDPPVLHRGCGGLGAWTPGGQR